MRKERRGYTVGEEAGDEAQRGELLPWDGVGLPWALSPAFRGIFSVGKVKSGPINQARRIGLPALGQAGQGAMRKRGGGMKEKHLCG